MQRDKLVYAYYFTLHTRHSPYIQFFGEHPHPTKYELIGQEQVIEQKQDYLVQG